MKAVDQRFPTVFEEIRLSGAIVPDGTWVERFAPGLLNPASCCATAKVAIRDQEFGEVYDSASILIYLYFAPEIARAAVAVALREVWLDFGIHGDVDAVVSLFSDLSKKVPEAIVTEDERNTLADLPDIVRVYRGQIFSDGQSAPTGMSWTLNEKVADWYAAPVPAIGEPRGWVMSATIPKSAILALFLERGEQEVVIDTRFATDLTSRRGTCDEFPKHLAQAR